MKTSRQKEEEEERRLKILTIKQKNRNCSENVLNLRQEEFKRSRF